MDELQFTPEQEDAIEAWMNSLAPETTEEEAEIAIKAAAVEEFVTLANKLIDSIEMLAMLGICDDLDELSNLAGVAAYGFSPDLDDHSLEDLS